MILTARTTAVLLLIATFILILGANAPAYAQSNNDAPLPAVFAGTAAIDRLTAPDGAEITATIDGVTVATTTVVDGKYAIRIPPNPEVNYSGMVVTFSIDGLPAKEKAVWTSDGGGTINLSHIPPRQALIRKGVLGINTVLTDREGMTLYAHELDTQATADTPAVSACSDRPCLVTWTPLASAGQPVAGKDVDPDLMSTTQHPTEGEQATYNGWPLYTSNNDNSPGQAISQGSNRSWWVVSTTGDPLRGTGLPGPAGSNGRNGRDGLDGKDGILGSNGQNGADGQNGISGQNGIDGQDGLDGRDGIDGKDGTDGAEGLQGTAGLPGKDGAQGTPGTTGQDGDAGITGIATESTSSPLGLMAFLLALVALGATVRPWRFVQRLRRAKSNQSQEQPPGNEGQS